MRTDGGGCDYRHCGCKKEKMKMKIICLHGWVVVVNESEATWACRTCRSTRMALQTARIQLEMPTENRQTGPKLPDSPTGEHKAMPRQNRSARELPKYADGTRICAQRFEGVEKI